MGLLLPLGFGTDTESNSDWETVAAASPALETIHDAELGLARLATPPGTFQAEPAPFFVRFGSVEIPFGVLATQVMPGERVSIVARDPENRVLALRYSSGEVIRRDTGLWQWIAPDEPGLVAVRLEREGGGGVHMNVLVLHPADHVQNGKLHGYRIGQYASGQGRGSAYQPPEGFVEVSESHSDVLVSPHFTLGQLVSKQPGEPRFMAYSLPLVVKLEAVLEEANRAGYSATTLHVMSAFRTPAYNAAIGNKTIYSRHLWGDAADVFVDEDGNGLLDDLDGNGRSERADAELLAALVARVEADREKDVFSGGLSVYATNAAHGPFVHVDARGTAARW